MLAILASIAKPFGLGSHLPTLVAHCWLATAWQCKSRFGLQVIEDLLVLELGGDKIPQPLGLAEMLEELAEVGQIVTDLPALGAHAELHHLKRL